MALDTLTDVQELLGQQGFVDDLIAHDGALRAAPSGRRFSPTELVIAGVYRFEGPTDPADEAILFALATPAGEPVGTFTAVYGSAVSAADEAIIQALQTADDVAK
jgi:hypothetical protein